jgi:hypothetical protein
MRTFLSITVPTADLTSQELSLAASALANTVGLHTAMAVTGEDYLRAYGRFHAPTQHATANRLGAKPTGHLEDAYNRIESSETASAASLWFPESSRLRAAFGSYTVRPTGGRQYLTIPVAAEAYGKRASEIPGLVPMRVGPKKTPILARPDGDRITTYYLLATEATIPEDQSLIPFDRLTEKVTDAAGEYIDQAIENRINNSTP